jgi:ERCC4-type nuclease
MYIKIVADDRERHVTPFFENLGGIEFEVKRLTKSDYSILVNDQLLHAFERKSMADLVQSLKTDNLHIKELLELRAETGCKVSYIIETKKVWYAPKTDVHGVSYNKIKALLDTIYLQHDIPIIYTKDCQGTADTLTLLAQRYNKLINDKGVTFNIKGGGTELLTAKKTTDVNQQIKRLFMSLPAVGPETADVLMIYSIMDLLTVPLDEIQKLRVNGTLIGSRLDGTINKLQGPNCPVHKAILLAITGMGDQKALRILNTYEFKELLTAPLEDMTFNNRRLGKVGERVKELLSQRCNA